MLYTFLIEYPKIILQIIFSFILLLIIEYSKKAPEEFEEEFNEALKTNDFKIIKIAK